MLKKTKFENISDNFTFFHFTERCNLESISKNGLISQVGKHSASIEENPKIFFAEGCENVLKLNDVWLKWLMNRMFGFYSLSRSLEGNSLKFNLLKWQNEYLSKAYKTDEKKKKVLFEKMYKQMDKRVFLALNLTINEDYDLNDTDEVKARLFQNKNSLDYLFFKEMYGNYSDMDTIVMERWNMHTLKNINIKPQNITIMEVNGSDNALDILIFFYDKFKDQKYDLLDDFIKYAKEYKINSN